MSSFVLDILIWLLLAAGVGFGILGFFGLLIFPDIRSRMFTASRATLIGAGLTVIAVALYGIVRFLEGNAAVYAILVLLALLLICLLATANAGLSRIILTKIPAPAAASSSSTTGPQDN